MTTVEPTFRWWDHAACRGMDTNLFFPERGPGISYLASSRDARAASVALCRMPASARTIGRGLSA